MAIGRYALVAACVIASYGDSSPLAPDELYRQAEARRRRWDLDGAQRLAGRGFRVWRGRTGSDWHWRFRLLQAEILLERGQTGSALPLLAGRAPGGELEARRRMNLATADFRQARLAQAAAGFAEASRLAQGEPAELRSEIEIKRGYLLAVQRRYAEAERMLAGAAARLAGRDPYLEAYARINLGFNRMRQGRLEEAIAAYQRARELAHGQGGSQRAAVLAAGNLGTCYFRLGDFERSLALLSEAVALAVTIGDKLDAKGYLGDTGNVYYRQGDYRRAISFYERSLRLAEELNDRAWVASMLNNLAEASLASGNRTAAAAFNRRALDLKRQFGDEASLAYSVLSAGQIALEEGRLDEAGDRFREALRLAGHAEEPAVEWAAHGGLASVLRTAGRPAQAEYRAAIDVIDRQWERLSRDQSKITFLAQLIRFYQDYVDFLVEAGESERALAVAESSRARVMAQKLGKAAVSPGVDTTALRRLSAESRTVLLAYWLAPRRSFVWMIGPEGVERYDLPPEAEIRERVEAYAAALEGRRDPLETGTESGEWLFAHLVAPLRAAIPAGWRVVQVPDGCLHRLNFETLPSAGRYWIEDSAISVAPSLGLLERASGAAAGDVLVIGDAVASREFPALAGVKPEIESIRRCYPGARVYTGAAANPEAYRAAAPERFAAIHFAAHATANRESPLDSAVILSPLNGNARLYARDVLELPLTADLVTLSACRSAGARAYSGEGLMGFSWAFLRAGARNVIAGLWDADDQATARLMARLYRERASGALPAGALRAAKLELLASPDTRAPYYWGPFVVFTRCLYKTGLPRHVGRPTPRP